MTKNVFAGVPKTIKVGALDYSFKAVDRIVDEDTGTESWGEVVYEDYTVTVQRGQPSVASSVDTLLHELLHAIWHETDLRGQIGKDLEERVVRNLSSGLIALFRDNPKLLRWMDRRLHGKA